MRNREERAKCFLLLREKERLRLDFSKRKAKDFYKSETFQKRAILFYKIGKWLKHKIELKDKPEREKKKSRLILFHEVAGILIF